MLQLLYPKGFLVCQPSRIPSSCYVECFHSSGFVFCTQRFSRWLRGKTLLSLPFTENFPRRSTSGSEFNTGRGSAAHKNVYKVVFLKPLLNTITKQPFMKVSLRIIVFSAQCWIQTMLTFTRLVLQMTSHFRELGNQSQNATFPFRTRGTHD